MNALEVSASSLGSIAECTTEAWVSKVCNLTTMERSAALRVGGDAHLALAHFFRTGGDKTGAMQVFEAAYRDWALANVLTGDIRCWPNAKFIVERWLEAHSDLGKLPFTYSPQDVEKKVEADLCEVDGMKVKLVGYVDLPVLDRATGTRQVVDHKFTGWLSTDSVGAWRLSAQFKAYAWAWREMTGEQVTGILVNAVEWSRIPDVQVLKSGAEKKCRTHGVPYSQCREFHAKRQLVPLTIMPQELDVWQFNARRLAEGFVKIIQATGPMDPMDAAALMPQEGTFSGACRWCEFKRYCMAGKPKHLLETSMVERPKRE